MPDERLERIAAAVADGTPVDWVLEEGSASPEERPLLRELRVVAEIAAAACGPGPGDTWGQLRLGSLLGSGAFGEVFRAHDPRLGRDVALKLLRETGAAEEAVAEGRLLAKVRHPGVVTVYGADHIAGRTGLWMELIEGRTLEELLRRSGPWDAKAAALAGAELCAALAAVHAAALVHRDVKAQNVMREAGGRIVLMDFGVGRRLPDAGGRPAGTPLYMAPEVLAGAAATTRSDLYSMGVLLYHLVTGGHPVAAPDIEGLKKAHAERDRRLLRDARPALPDAFVRVVERALQPEPERRFATAGEMEQALLDSLLPSERRVAAEPGPARGHRFESAAAAVFLLAALALVWRTIPDERGGRAAPSGLTGATPAPAVEASPQRPDARPAVVDPFVPPLGAPGATGVAVTPVPDPAYSIEAALEGETLRVRTSAALSLYVFAIDEADRPLLVFPIPGRRPENPLVPGQDTRLWIGAAPRRSRLVAVASPARLASLETEMGRQRVPLASWLGALPLTEPALTHLGSALGFAPRDTGRFLAGAPPLAGHVEMLRGAWVRRVERQ
jgi:serine/threonine-protein kinase